MYNIYIITNIHSCDIGVRGSPPHSGAPVCIYIYIYTYSALRKSCCSNARTHLSRRGAALSVKHRYSIPSLILHASIAEITAQILYLSYVYLISSDDGSIIRIFVQINILEGRAFNVVLMGRVAVTISYSFRYLTTDNLYLRI